MPIYEYNCLSCGKYLRFFLTYQEYDTVQLQCPACQSKDLKRRINRVGIAKSEDTRMDNLIDDSSLAGLDEEDPRTLGRFMRKMSNEMGEEMGDEFNEVVERLEKGESPESIEESIPDLGSDFGDDF
jgi:putative FmdB family regulatory protein